MFHICVHCVFIGFSHFSHLGLRLCDFKVHKLLQPSCVIVFDSELCYTNRRQIWPLRTANLKMIQCYVLGCNKPIRVTERAHALRSFLPEQCHPTCGIAFRGGLGKVLQQSCCNCFYVTKWRQISIYLTEMWIS